MDIAAVFSLMFAFTAANHLGLIAKVEEIAGRSLPVLNCPRCASFWGSFVFLLVTRQNIIGAAAMSFLVAYLAIWLELVMCIVDFYYAKVYEKFVSGSATDTTASDADNGGSDSRLSNVRKK